MSSIKIAKGYPISLLVTLNSNTVPININDGTWTYNATLNFQTDTGTTPFDLTITPSANQFLIEIANTQTSLLDHLSTGYVLVITCAKNDNTAFLKNEIPVSITNGL